MRVLITSILICNFIRIILVMLQESPIDAWQLVSRLVYVSIRQDNVLTNSEQSAL